MGTWIMIKIQTVKISQTIKYKQYNALPISARTHMFETADWCPNKIIATNVLAPVKAFNRNHYMSKIINYAVVKWCDCDNRLLIN